MIGDFQSRGNLPFAVPGTRPPAWRSLKRSSFRFPVFRWVGFGAWQRQKKAPGEKTAFRRIKNWGVICCAQSSSQNGNPGKEKKGSAMGRKSKLTIAIATAVLSVLGAAVYAQDKYLLKSPSGIAFSDFRGYEDWAVVSSARTDEVLKVIVANPTMIKAYKAGVPGNGQPFPDGSMIVKLQWKPKKSTEAPFVVDVPDVFTQAFVIEKDSKRFPKSGGWGYAVFNYEAASDKFTADPKSPSDCGHACHTAVKAKDYIFHPYQKR